MKTGLQVLGASGTLSAAEVVNNGCVLLRNLILARVLDKGDFGIAATLALVVAMFELAGKMSFGQQVMQSLSGDDTEFQHSAHACQGLAGTVGAALILLCSFPLSHWFGLEQHRWAFMLLAVIPLCTGFASLEVYRLVRHLRFTPLVLTDTAPQLLVTLATWPLAAWFRDYRAVLYILLAKAVLSLAASHLLAERPYGMCWRLKLVRENLRFGWPLLVSSFVMFGIFQGDRMLVAGAYTLSELGAYAAASTLAMTPAMALFKVSGTVSIPIMAKAQADLPKFRFYYSLFAQFLALCAAVFVVIMILEGATIITLLLGEKYRDAAALAAWLTVGQAFRILRGAPACAALARGDTVNGLVSNLWRLSGLALAVPMVILKLDLKWVAAAAIVGEVIALAVSLLRLRQKHGLYMGDCLRPTWLMALLAVAAYLARGALAPTQVSSTLVLAGVGCLLPLVLFGAFFPVFRGVFYSLLSEVQLKVRQVVKNGGFKGLASDT